MTTRTTVSFLAFGSLLVVAAACGSPPKAELPNVTPPLPSAETSPTPPASPLPAAAAEAGAPAAPSGKMSAADCDALVDDANLALDAERIKVDKVCKKDADCMPIKGRACAFVCQNGAIPKGEETEWNGTLTKVKDTQCKKWTENECPKTSPPKTPSKCGDDGKKPACNKGHCILK